MRWGTFPSVALGWRVTEESFLKNNKVLSNLKVRASYGVTGQQDGIGNYNYLPIYTISQNGTLPATQYELPEKCVIKAGELTGEILVVLKYYEKLDTKAELLTLQVNDGCEVRQGPSVYSRAIISVSNLLFAPEWWTRNDGDVNNPYNIVEEWYLGRYSEKKYLMFLEELKKDGVVFDGKDMFILRKYALRLKNRIKDYNTQHPDEPMSDEYGKMEIPVAG